MGHHASVKGTHVRYIKGTLPSNIQYSVFATGTAKGMCELNAIIILFMNKERTLHHHHTTRHGVPVHQSNHKDSSKVNSCVVGKGIQTLISLVQEMNRK